MIIRRNFLQGLAAGASTVSISSRSALALADTAMRRTRASMKYLKACVIACEESYLLDENSNIVDYWTFDISDISVMQLPEWCRKVVIADSLISRAGIVRDLGKIHQSIPKYFDFDPLDHPNHCALHVEGVTDFREAIRSVLATKSKRVAKAKIALVNEDSFCLHCSIDWADILPMLHSHYDHIVSISDIGYDEASEFYDAKHEAYKKNRHEQIAAHCETAIRLPLPDYSKGTQYDYDRTKNMIYAIADVFFRKTPVEILALPSCGDISFRDWTTFVARSGQEPRLKD